VRHLLIQRSLPHETFAENCRIFERNRSHSVALVEGKSESRLPIYSW